MTRFGRSPVTPPDWARYLEDFHAKRPGITEAVLTGCRAGGATPYQWLAAGAGDGEGILLDLACGSGPLVPHVDPFRYVGLDRSDPELRIAERRHPGVALVRGDGGALPFPDRSIGVVACSLALMVMTPAEAVVAEIARVTSPVGTLAVLLPATSPLGARDRIRYARLLLALRTRAIHFPTSAVIHDAHRLVETAGYTIVSDERIRFSYRVTDAASADALVDSLYLPTTPAPRLEVARGSVRGWSGTDLGIPLRRIVATRDVRLGVPGTLRVGR